MGLPPERVIAVDWSGAVTGERKKIWLCEVSARGVERLESGRTREELVAEVVRAAGSCPRLVAGFDFAFSFPRWFLDARKLPSARALWALATREGESWLRADAPPFWGAKGTRPAAVPAQTRATEDAAGVQARMPPSSVFKLVGAGQVGRGSIRGMAALLALGEAGFVVWPFDRPAPDRPTVVEIWPRLLYVAPVKKSRPDGRSGYLDRYAPDLGADVREAATGSDDAFDALTSALRMWQCRAGLAALSPARNEQERMEGCIWAPPA